MEFDDAPASASEEVKQADKKEVKKEEKNET